MSDLRETVARALDDVWKGGFVESSPWTDEWDAYADAAIAAARPIIERELIERLIAEAEKAEGCYIQVKGSLDGSHSHAEGWRTEWSPGGTVYRLRKILDKKMPE